MPHQQRADHTDVDRPVPKYPVPHAREPSSDPATIQDRQCGDRGDDADDADCHHYELELSGSGDEAGIDIDSSRKTLLNRDLQFGKHPGNLWLLIRRERACRTGDADEICADRARVGPGPHCGARARRDCRTGCDRRDLVAESHGDRVRGGPYEQTVARCVDPVGGISGENQSAGRGQGGNRRAGDRNVECLGCAGDQWCGDVSHRSARSRALGPQDGGGCLPDGQQRSQRTQRHARKAREDCDKPRDPD